MRSGHDGQSVQKSRYSNINPGGCSLFLFIPSTGTQHGSRAGREKKTEARAARHEKERTILYAQGCLKLALSCLKHSFFKMLLPPNPIPKSKHPTLLHQNSCDADPINPESVDRLLQMGTKLRELISIRASSLTPVSMSPLLDKIYLRVSLYISSSDLIVEAAVLVLSGSAVKDEKVMLRCVMSLNISPIGSSCGCTGSLQPRVPCDCPSVLGISRLISGETIGAAYMIHSSMGCSRFRILQLGCTSWLEVLSVESKKLWAVPGTATPEQVIVALTLIVSFIIYPHRKYYCN